MIEYVNRKLKLYFADINKQINDQIKSIGLHGMIPFEFDYLYRKNSGVLTTFH